MLQFRPTLDKARHLADAGRFAEVIEFLDERPREEIEASSALSLLYGMAHARLGRSDKGKRWVEFALARAREREEEDVEIRALNTRGAIAFVSGRIDQAADYFTQGLLAASRAGDHTVIGRCSNNLGSINNLRGRHAEAVAAHALAVAAFQRAGDHRGVAEARHNMGISLREQRRLDEALREATSARAEAVKAGDLTLAAMTLRGQAEIHVDGEDLDVAQDAIQEALREHRDLKDAVEEAQDLRIVSAIHAARGESGAAETMLLEVIARAKSQDRPLLVAEATRDLAYVLRRQKRQAAALDAARSAIAQFERLGAEAEVRKLDSHEWGYPLRMDLARSLEPLHEAQRLADAGHYADLVEHLRCLPEEILEQSPTLALLYGIGLARLGRLEAAEQWTMIALARSRATGDRAVEVRALNAYGAIALDRGGIDAAVEFFTKAQEEAMREGDLETVARAANNLGIVANMQGDYGRAVGSYTMALAAYQRAGFERGVAETHHNLGITYRDQGSLVEAMSAADRAVSDAERLGDRSLEAQTIAGRAEIRLARQEPQLAHLEAKRAAEIHRDLGDTVRESEDLRILAGAMAAADRYDDAERLLTDVIQRATEHHRPLLAATAQRDLAQLFDRLARTHEARTMAEQARATFDRLGARVQVERIDAFLARPHLAA